MNPALVELLEKVVVPIVTAFFHEFFNKNGRLPTATEVTNHLVTQDAVSVEADRLEL